MTKLTGHLLIGATELAATAGTMKALNPSTNVSMEPEFAFGSEADVNRAIRLADEAFDSYNATTLYERAAFLERIADGLEQVAPELADRTSMETGLPVAQLLGETAKAAATFRKFATVVRQGRFRQASIDPAQPDRTPLPRMDHRLQKIGVGPIAIFGASNFPISYSVAGNDTASALAAGCPVVLKAHNGHPGSSEIQGRVIRNAVRDSGLHEGVFSLVRGSGNEIGETLVTHPLIRSVAFTGSEGGGMALYRLAQRRVDPIPVFAEMTSVNPTFILPAAMASRGHAIGDGFTERMLVTVGQACLKPAILVAVDALGFDLMRQAMIDRVAAGPARTMLTPGIHQAYRANVARLEHTGAHRIAQGSPESGEWEGRAFLFEVDGARFLAEPTLSEEVFGPTALLVRAKDVNELVAIARTFEGQLSATMHLEREDLKIAGQLLPILERRTGRIVVNAFAHPQEVGYATIHGGPFPATTDSRFTSVGMSSIERFLRPVCYQGFPDDLLPESLKAANPLGLSRLVDGEPRQD